MIKGDHLISMPVLQLLQPIPQRVFSFSTSRSVGFSDEISGPRLCSRILTIERLFSGCQLPKTQKHGQVIGFGFLFAATTRMKVKSFCQRLTSREQQKYLATDTAHQGLQNPVSSEKDICLVWHERREPGYLDRLSIILRGLKGQDSLGSLIGFYSKIL